MTFDAGLVIASIFQLAGGLTAILFSVYCFCVVSSNAFMDKIRHTQTFNASRDYIKFTFDLGFLLTMIALMASAVPQAKEFQEIFIFPLSILTVWWLCRFAKCYKIFETFSSAP
jgi:hypothetical protein